MRRRWLFVALIASLTLLLVLSARPAPGQSRGDHPVKMGPDGDSSPIAPTARRHRTRTAEAVGIRIPGDSTPRELESLSFEGDEERVALSSFRLEQAPEPGADPNHAVWVLTSTQDSGQDGRIAVRLVLCDESGKVLARSRGTVVLDAAETSQELNLRMKVKPESWSRAEELRISATFVGGRGRPAAPATASRFEAATPPWQ